MEARLHQSRPDSMPPPLLCQLIVVDLTARPSYSLHEGRRQAAINVCVAREVFVDGVYLVDEASGRRNTRQGAREVATLVQHPRRGTHLHLPA